MDFKSLDKLRNIVRDANRIRGLKAWYEDRTSVSIYGNSSCDKHGAAFCVDKRFAVFDAGPVSFDCYVGYYGNSSCSEPFSVADPDAAKNAFRRALNKHKWLILETMADYLMEDANRLRSYAESEIAGAQAMLDSVRKETEDVLQDAVEGGRA